MHYKLAASAARTNFKDDTVVALPRFGGPLSVLLGVTLVVLLPLTVRESAPGTDRVEGAIGAALAIQVGLIAWSGVRIALIVRRGSPAFLDLVFWIFVYLWMSLAPFAQIATDRFPLPSRFDSTLFLSASLVTAVGVVGYEIGKLLASRRAPRSPSAGDPKSMLGSTWGAIVVLTILATGFAIVLTPRFGGLEPFLTSRQALDTASAGLQGDSQARALTGIYTSLLSVTPLVALLGWLDLFRRDSRSMKRPMRLICLLLLVGLNVLFNNPISNSRSWFSVCVVAILVSVKWSVAYRYFPVLAALLIASAILVFPIAGVFRYDQAAIPVENSSISSQYTDSGDYDAYQQSLAGLEYTERYGLDGGQHLLGPVFFFVPRSLWSGKPEDTGITLAEFKGYGYTNLSSPLWIELYISFSFPGVLIGFAILGALWHRLDKSFRSLKFGVAGFIGILVPLVAMYQTAILRGSLLTATGRLVIVIAMVWVMFGRRAPSRE